MPPLELHHDADLTLDDFLDVVDGRRAVTLSQPCADALQQSHDFFSQQSLSDDVYGLNTGLGPMVTSEVAPTDLREQQYQLVFSHAAGLGDPLSYRFASAAALARAISLTRGRSAVRPDVPDFICTMLNQGVAPFIPRHGGVGASGDLVQLAHLALGLIGHGQLLTPSGPRDAAVIIRSELDRAPIELQFRDGLALCNGTSCMTGIGLCNVADAKRLMEAIVECTAVLARTVGLSPDPYSDELNRAKRHKGQRRIAAMLREHRATLPEDANRASHRPLQEYYSIRCAPQILGPLLDTIEFIEQTMLNEINSVSDNPIFDPADRAIYHGGNFHGEAAASAMDQLKAATIKITMLMERQLNFLVNDEVNKSFPPFLNKGKLGVDFGLQGAQFTAVSTTAHSQSLAYPMSLHSIPSNKDNQDVVSMGTDAALMGAEALDNAFRVLSILSLAIHEAAHFQGLGGHLASRDSSPLAFWQENQTRERLTGSLHGDLEQAYLRLRTAV